MEEILFDRGHVSRLSRKKDIQMVDVQHKKRKTDMIPRHVNRRSLSSDYVAIIESISLPTKRIRSILLQYSASTKRMLSVSLQFFKRVSVLPVNMSTNYPGISTLCPQ